MFSFFKKLDRNSRSTLLTCFFIYTCSGIYTLIMGSVMPDLKAAYNLSDTFSGLILSAHSAGNMIAGFVSALIPLYLGERRSITVLASLLPIGFVMVLVSGNPVWLLVALVLTGFGRGSVTNFNNRTVNVVSGGSPAAANLLHASFAIGAIAAPMLFLAVRNWLGWRAGIICVLMIGAVGIWRLTRLKLPNDRPDRKDKTNSTLCFLKNPSFLILGLMMFFYLCAEYAVNGWLVTYIQSKQSLLSSFSATGEELTAAVRAYSQSMATLLWLVILFGRLFCAAMSSKVSQKVLMLVASIGVAAFYGVMLASGSIQVVTVCVAGLGFCMAGICPMIYSDAAIFTNTYPMATSIILAIGSSGAILMPTIVGALAERFGFEGGMSAILVAMVLLVVFSFLNVAVKTRVPDEAKK